MADSAPVVHIGENSPEYVAFKLLHYIADVERKVFFVDTSGGRQAADRS